MKNFTATEAYWMAQALQRAQRAAQLGEVPVGAILVWKNFILAEGWNQPTIRCDPTAHAELIALRQAAARLHNYRLTGTVLYVTLEPCPMCVGAIIQARIKRLVFAAYDPYLGAVGSRFNILQTPALAYKPDFIGGILEKPAQQLLQAFFRQRRLKIASNLDETRSLAGKLDTDFSEQ